MINAEVSKTGSENALSTIRKFTRRVQGTGLVRTIRGGRYYSRLASKTVKKKSALKMLKRKDEFRRLIKEGKVVETTNRRPFTREAKPANTTESNPPIAR